jgi:hypothetical protein
MVDVSLVKTLDGILALYTTQTTLLDVVSISGTIPLSSPRTGSRLVSFKGLYLGM